MKLINVFIFFCLFFDSSGQTKPGTSFDGAPTQDVNVCPQSKGAFLDEEVKRLINEMLERYGLQKDIYNLVPCSRIDNCQATLYDGQPYILYNAEFLQDEKRLNFAVRDISITEKSWKVLTILAHELGHHLNNHLTKPQPGVNPSEIELQADQTAGFIIYLMGGSLQQAQLAFQQLSENETYQYASRQKRLNAVANGWNNAKKKYPRTIKVPDPKTVQDRDGNIYKTVKIGEQLWLQSNLNVSKFRDGTAIPQAKTAEEWEKAGEQGKPAWCFYDNNPENGKIYGKLYNWYAVNDPRGLAPVGWHIPSDEEWTSLTDHLGGNEVAGGKLKAKFKWEIPNTSATNSVGFAGIPGGGCDYFFAFGSIGKFGLWWSATGEKIYARCLMLGWKSSNADRLDGDKDHGMSVRCLRD